MCQNLCQQEALLYKPGTSIPPLDLVILGLADLRQGCTLPSKVISLIITFLVLEPHGLAQLWRVIKEKLRLWPFPH